MEIITQWFNNFLSIIKTFQFKDLLDIVAIAFIIYSIIKLVRQTRAEQLLKGIFISLIVYFFSSVFGLTMLTSILKTFIEFAVILIAIIFQPEIRKALENIGRSKLSQKSFKLFSQSSDPDDIVAAQKKAIVDVADSAQLFSRSKTGALIVFERQTKLEDIAATGTVLDSKTSVAVIGNIFFNKAPLHDGACIIRGGLIHSAGCILPLTKNKDVDINLGTRHRASLGMSEESDAVVLVVSEETGTISIAVNGVLLSGFDRSSLEEKLFALIIGNEEEKSDLFPFFQSRKRKEDK